MGTGKEKPYERYELGGTSLGHYDNPDVQEDHYCLRTHDDFCCKYGQDYDFCPKSK